MCVSVSVCTRACVCVNLCTTYVQRVWFVSLTRRCSCLPTLVQYLCVHTQHAHVHAHAHAHTHTHKHTGPADMLGGVLIIAACTYNELGGDEDPSDEEQVSQGTVKV